MKPRPTLAGRCHIQLDTEDRERLAAQGDDEEEEEASVVPTATADSEDEEDATPAPAPSFEATPSSEPKKVVKKRVVRKAKGAA